MAASTLLTFGGLWTLRHRGSHDLVTRCRFGAYARNEPYPVDPHFALERAVGGTKLPVCSWFQEWGSSWPRREADKLTARGGYDVLMCWEAHGVHFRDILSGKHDQYIREYVNAAATYPGEVVLRLFHESNGNWYDWTAGSGRGFCSGPDQWKLAWRKVVQVARSTGRHNVKFFWCMNARDIGGPPMESLFPGVEWVDYVGVDAYRVGAEDFDHVLNNAYGRITRLDTKHDFWVGETGADTRSRSGAKFFESAYTSQGFPRLKTVCWFHAGRFNITADSASVAVHREQLPRMPQYGGRRQVNPRATP